MTARDDHPFAGTGDRYRQWNAMADEIDSLQRTIDRLWAQIEQHRETHYCRYMPDNEL